MAPRAYTLIFFTALFAAVRCTFFASGCFGSHCLTTTPAPRPRLRASGLRSLLQRNYDDTYDRSARSLTENLKKLPLPLVSRARLNVPVVSFPRVHAELIGVEQIGPPQDQYVEFRPTAKKHSDVYHVIGPRGSSKWYSNQKTPKIVRQYTLSRNVAPRVDRIGLLPLEGMNNAPRLSIY